MDNQIKGNYDGIPRNRLLRVGIVEEAFKDKFIIWNFKKGQNLMDIPSGIYFITNYL